MIDSDEENNNVEDLQRRMIHMNSVGRIIDWTLINDEERRRDVAFPDSSMWLFDANQEQIKQLRISGCPHATIPSDFGRFCTELTHLQLWNCRITALPQTICQLERLEYLSLHYCRSLTELPDSIGRLRYLKELDIFYCMEITRLPVSIGDCTNLKELKIFKTGITSLPNEICNATSLEILRIEENRDRDNIFRLQPSVIDIIRNLPNLSTLELGTSTSFINSLPILPRLKALYLNVFITGNDGASAINIFDVNDWKENSTLQQLTICHKPLEGANSESNYGNILRNLPKTLVSLYLSDCKVDGILDVVTSVDLPQGLRRLGFIGCNGTAYSDSERINCFRKLTDKYERLGNITICDYGLNTPRLKYVVPIHEMFLLKYNKCGRILVQRNEGTPCKPILLSVWPTVLAKVREVVLKDEEWKNSTCHDKELEATILFRFLQGSVFLGRTSIDMENATTSGKWKRIS